MIGTLNPDAKTGVIESEPEDAYRFSGAIGSSALNDFIANERLFHRKHVLGIAGTGRYQPFVVGQACHCRVLEPDKFAAQYAAKPEGFDGRTKEGKAWVAENSGKQSLTAEEAGTVTAMVNALNENDEARELLTGNGPNELTIRLNIDRWKLPVQVRLDAWRPKAGMIVDLKTTSDLSAWPRELAKFGYHRQACLYSHLTGLGMMIEDPRFCFVVVEKVEPYRVGLFRLSDEWLSRAWAEIDEGMKRLRRCLDTNTWRRDEPGVKVIDLPKWAKESA